jgi:hypothetical protein
VKLRSKTLTPKRKLLPLNNSPTPKQQRQPTITARARQLIPVMLRKRKRMMMRRLTKLA